MNKMRGIRGVNGNNIIFSPKPEDIDVLNLKINQGFELLVIQKLEKKQIINDKLIPFYLTVEGDKGNFPQGFYTGTVLKDNDNIYHIELLDNKNVNKYLFNTRYTNISMDDNGCYQIEDDNLKNGTIVFENPIFENLTNYTIECKMSYNSSSKDEYYGGIIFNGLGDCNNDHCKAGFYDDKNPPDGTVDTPTTIGYFLNKRKDGDYDSTTPFQNTIFEDANKVFKIEKDVPFTFKISTSKNGNTELYYKYNNQYISIYKTSGIWEEVAGFVPKIGFFIDAYTKIYLHNFTVYDDITGRVIFDLNKQKTLSPYADTTLTISDAAADAKVTGEAIAQNTTLINSLESKVDSVEKYTQEVETSLTQEIKNTEASLRETINNIQLDAGAQSDWNQYDSSKNSYIHNRTHYDDVIEEIIETILYEGDFSYTSGGSFGEVAYGEGYILYFDQEDELFNLSESFLVDGVKYSDPEVLGSDWVFTLLNYNNEIMIYQDLDMYQYQMWISKNVPGNGYYTISNFTSNTTRNLKKLDEKYIPDSIIARIAELENKVIQLEAQLSNS